MEIQGMDVLCSSLTLGGLRFARPVSDTKYNYEVSGQSKCSVFSRFSEYSYSPQAPAGDEMDVERPVVADGGFSRIRAGVYPAPL
ncbi:hypothetical protein [Paenibacillus sp. NPDC057934]|uniref:hypothetical protein n=1 Tax=Paenibacillus sp. NPDC057934 TaxID=3346282 RepID=UPI0036D8C22A